MTLRVCQYCGLAYEAAMNHDCPRAEKRFDPRRKAVLRVSLDMIARALKLPDSVRVVAIHIDTRHLEGDPDVLLIKVLSDDLPVVLEGQRMPYADVEYRSRAVGDETVVDFSSISVKP